MSIRFYRYLCGFLLTLTLSTLSGCGFQLRGYNQELPFRTLYIESNQPYTNFIKELRQTLKAANIYVYLSPPAPITLQIISQNFNRTITSLGNAGQTTTYLLSFTTLFQLVDNSNHILLPSQQVRATRNFSITSDQLSGDLNTQNDLQEDMQRDTIQQILARLASPALRRQFSQSYPHP